MFRKIISIVFYILGGFFVYMVCLLAFINIPEAGPFKFAIMGGFSVPAVISLILGAVACPFKNWKSPVGIAVLSGVGFNLLVVFTFVCILLTPEFEEYFPRNSLAAFNDYFSGTAAMLVLAGVGGVLLITGKRQIAAQLPEPDL